MTLVVDASVAIRWSFPMDGAERANALLRSGDRLIAPDLILPEITNGAWKLVTFGSAPAEATQAIVNIAERAFDEIVPSVALKDRAFAIALELRHPAYDCFYLALAEVRQVPFVTADERLLRRCAGTRFRARVKPL